jgi:hypothetical protein
VDPASGPSTEPTTESPELFPASDAGEQASYVDVEEAPSLTDSRETGTGAASAWDRPARRASTGLTAGLAVLVLLLGALAWLIGPPSQPAERYGEARLDALAAARSAAVDLISVNYQALDAQEKKAKSHLAMGSKFAKDYVTFLPKLRDTYTRNKLVLTTDVSAAGVIRVVDAKHVLVLAFIDQVSTNAARSTPRIDQNRVRLHMVESGGKWLVEGLEAL